MTALGARELARTSLVPLKMNLHCHFDRSAFADLTDHPNPHRPSPPISELDSHDEIEVALMENPRRRFNQTYGQSQGPLRPYNRYSRNTRASDYKLKIDIFWFDGHLHIENFLDWLQNVKSFLEYI